MFLTKILPVIGLMLKMCPINDAVSAIGELFDTENDRISWIECDVTSLKTT